MDSKKTTDKLRRHQTGGSQGDNKEACTEKAGRRVCSQGP